MLTVSWWLRLAAAAATLAAVIWALGVGPFIDGARAVDGRALLAAVTIGALTTSCCAWRWTIVARGLGVHLPLPAAIASYYRSVFLNLTLPGGVVGTSIAVSATDGTYRTSVAASAPSSGSVAPGSSCRPC